MADDKVSQVVVEGTKRHSVAICQRGRENVGRQRSKLTSAEEGR